MELLAQPDRIQYLTSTLQQVNQDFSSTIDEHLKRLKEEERELQNLLKLKARRELINSMEKDLGLDFLNNSTSLSSSQLNSVNLSKSLNNSVNRDLLKSSNSFKDSLENTANDLRKSEILLRKLTNEHSNLTSSAGLSAQDFIKRTATNPSSTITNNLTLNKSVEPIRPNVIYATKSAKNPLRASYKYLNGQQTLVYNESFFDQLGRSKSSNELNKSTKKEDTKLMTRSLAFEQEYAQALRNRHLQSASLPRSKLSNSGKFEKSRAFATLPLSKTLIHEKPWTPGKVETNYYSFRKTQSNKN